MFFLVCFQMSLSGHSFTKKALLALCGKLIMHTYIVF